MNVEETGWEDVDLVHVAHIGISSGLCEGPVAGSCGLGNDLHITGLLE